MDKLKLKSANIDCPHCVENIRHKVGNVYGVDEVQGDASRKEVTITYDPRKVKPDSIKEAMADAGYPVSS